MELVKKWKNAIPSCTKDGFDVGILMQKFSEDIRTSLLRVLGLNEREKENRPFVELGQFIKSLTSYFNFYETVSFSPENLEFRSFNGKEIKTISPTHTLLQEGGKRKIAWLRGFIDNDGTPPAVPASLIMFDS
jgi:hypothetical protein